jgi:Bacterial Ig-like domain
VREPPVANSEVTEAATFGVLRLELNAGSYGWTFLPEAGHTFMDTGSGACHGAPTEPPPPETTPPTVTSRTPGVGATNVAVGTTVTATFDEPVTGVSASTFRLEGPGAAAVPASVTYDGSTRTATLDPTDPLADATTYTARLTAGITDTSPNANPLVPLNWTFSTAGPPVSAGITLRSASSGDNLAATSLVLPRPGNVVAGDVMLATVAARGTPTISAPPGWTLVRIDANASTVRQAVFLCVVGASEPASYSFGLSSAQSAAGGIVAYGGVDPANPIDAAGGQVNASSPSVTAPSVTTTGPDRMLVGFSAMATLTSMTPRAA